MRINVHVDDFLVTGLELDLIWLRDCITKIWEVKSKILGGTDNPVGEAVFLGRTIRMTDRGIEVEGDQKHSDVLIKEWNLTEGKGV